MADLEVGKLTYQQDRRILKVILVWLLGGIAYICVYYSIFDQVPFYWFYYDKQHHDSFPSTAHDSEPFYDYSPSTAHNSEIYYDPLHSTAYESKTLHNSPPYTTHDSEILHDFPSSVMHGSESPSPSSSSSQIHNDTSPETQKHPSSHLHHQTYVVNAYYVRFYAPSCFSSYYLSANVNTSVEPGITNSSNVNSNSTQMTENSVKLSISSENITICYERIRLVHLQFYEELSKKGIKIKIRYEFWDLINVLSIEFEERHLDIVKSIKGVKSIQRVYNHRITPRTIESPFVESKIINKKRDDNELSEKREWIPVAKIEFAPGNDINSIHNFTGVEQVRQRFGLTGKEIKVGIVDSGVDYTHPALGGCFGSGCRVRYGYDFVDDDYDPNDDCLGHGTHVAGIVGGDDRRPEGTGFTGVAPDVIFGAYRVVKCDGYAYNDIILKGMQRAKDDGMDIINLSITGDGWAESPTSEMADILSKLGIVVVASNGNYGTKGLWESGVPAIGLDAVSVSSVENTHLTVYKAFVTSNRSIEIDYITKLVRPFPLEKAKVAVYPTNKCLQDFSAYKSKILVIDIANLPKTCTLVASKIQKYVSGVFALEINSSVPLYPSLELPTTFTVPYATLIPKQFHQLVALAEEFPELELDFSDTYTYLIPNEFGKVVSPFTSWGLTPELDIKPELSAPGGMMFSLYPLKYGGYSMMSGTSMSSPYVAGSAALLLEKHGYQGPRTSLLIRQELMNYAIPTVDVRNEFASVLQQGAGLINVYNSVSVSTLITPAKLALNDTLNGNFSWCPLWIYNGGNATRNYTLSNLPVASVDGYVNGTRSASYKQMKFSNQVVAEVEFHENFVAVEPGENKSVLIKITPPKVNGTSRWFYSGFILVESRNDGVNITVPYAGYASTARELPMMPLPTYPRLLTSSLKVVLENASATYSMSDNDTPIIQYALSTPTRYLRADILDENKSVLFLYAKANYVSKSRLTKGIPPWFYWDGSKGYEGRKSKKSYEIVPDGTYYIRLSALKLLADPDEDESWERWISPKIIVSS